MCIRDSLRRIIGLFFAADIGKELIYIMYKPVSYTHLDVYKRQLQFLLLNSRQIEGRALAGISSFRLLAVIFNSSYLDNASLGIDFYLLAQPAAAFQQRARHHRAKPLH